MKLRLLLLIALPLAIVAVLLWFLAGRDGAGEIPPDVTISSESVPTTAAAPLAAAPSARPEPPPAVATPPPPVRPTASAVMAGEPLIRTVTVPQPVVKAAPVPGQRPAAPPDPAVEGAEDLEAVRTMFGDYRTRMGENPVGSNSEIMRAVMGGNQAKAILGPPQGQNLNGEGELLDRWGTPYFFHQISSTSMEIRSAGPDRIHWTPDDLVAK